MTDTTANHQPAPSGSSAIAELLQGLEPMGDLSRFVVDDLSPDEEDEFFRSLEGA